MKKTAFTLILIVPLLVMGQKDGQPKTLISSNPESISGFGGVIFSFLPIDGTLSTMTGGGGAVLFDNTFFVGGYGLGLSGNDEFDLAGERFTSSFDHGGFWMGYILKPDRLVHAGVEARLGWGSITTKSIDTNAAVADDEVFVVNPQVFGEVNITYWFKINATFGLQKTIGVDGPYYDATDFDGATFGLSLLFGWFQ